MIPRATPRWRSLVDSLGIVSEPLRTAMLRVPRAEFLPDRWSDEADLDTPVPLGVAGATTSAPHMIALQLEAARLSPGQRVLEVGAGMGYLMAIAAELVRPGGSVHGVEVDSLLAAEARRRLGRWGPSVTCTVRSGDGAEGWSEAAPFDRILVSCQTDRIAPPWQEQLVRTGRLVVPLGDGWEQELTVLSRDGERWRSEPGPSCRFVPLRRRLPRDI